MYYQTVLLYRVANARPARIAETVSIICSLKIIVNPISIIIVKPHTTKVTSVRLSVRQVNYSVIELPRIHA